MEKVTEDAQKNHSMFQSREHKLNQREEMVQVKALNPYCVGSHVSVSCAHLGGLPESLQNGTTYLKTETDAEPLSSYGRRRRQLKVEYDKDEGAPPVKMEHWEPLDWKRQLGHIREMRSSRDAPVDYMGAEKCYDSEAPAHVGVFNLCF